MKIVIDSRIPYIKGVFEPYAEVIYMAGNEISRCDIADAEALVVRTRTLCDRALLEGTRVRTIASATIGFDHIDMEYCHGAGIEVVTAAGSNARGVLQWVGAALAYAARIGGWEPSQKTIGVVGVGHVGSLVAEYAREWGFEVLCCDPPRASAEGAEEGGDAARAKGATGTGRMAGTGTGSAADIAVNKTEETMRAEGAEHAEDAARAQGPAGTGRTTGTGSGEDTAVTKTVEAMRAEGAKGGEDAARAAGKAGGAPSFVSFHEIARRCDIVTFHVPLTHTGPDATYHMADAAFLASIGSGTLIINTSRGEVIDSDELLSAVRAGRCTSCIDTWENEPDIDRVLLADSMLATPHIAGYSAQGKANATAAVVRALARKLSRGVRHPENAQPVESMPLELGHPENALPMPLELWYPESVQPVEPMPLELRHPENVQSMPLELWYPESVPRVVPVPISWNTLRATISQYFDIHAQSCALKTHPDGFEEFRDTYIYRQEYF